MILRVEQLLIFKTCNMKMYSENELLTCWQAVKKKNDKAASCFSF